jgi:hypothetical protein
MSNSRQLGVGLALRLSKGERRRLEALAEATGHTPEGVVRRFLQTVRGDQEMVARLRGPFAELEQEDADATR